VEASFPEEEEGRFRHEQDTFIMDSVVEVEVEEGEGEEEGLEVTEEYLMEIDKDNLVIEVVHQRSADNNGGAAAWR